ncbi:hypothetical protein SAMN05661093_10775 [Kibdelosporangium aridum]|uniref:Uncharacterized protein n=1 Tax=Kibdelosporangium aridum TaxID=2030 RepID=A0A1W2FZX0_KIBAR|nr:hypothetical protein SAMN05661093_10775 [Kibdelosporangium aridum]
MLARARKSSAASFRCARSCQRPPITPRSSRIWQDRADTLRRSTWMRTLSSGPVSGWPPRESATWRSCSVTARSGIRPAHPTTGSWPPSVPTAFPMLGSLSWRGRGEDDEPNGERRWWSMRPVIQHEQCHKFPGVICCPPRCNVARPLVWTDRTWPPLLVGSSSTDVRRSVPVDRLLAFTRLNCSLVVATCDRSGLGIRSRCKEPTDMHDLNT